LSGAAKKKVRGEEKMQIDIKWRRAWPTMSSSLRAIIHADVFPAFRGASLFSFSLAYTPLLHPPHGERRAEAQPPFFSVYISSFG